MFLNILSCFRWWNKQYDWTHWVEYNNTKTSMDYSDRIARVIMNSYTVHGEKWGGPNRRLQPRWTGINNYAENPRKLQMAFWLKAQLESAAWACSLMLNLCALFASEATECPGLFHADVLTWGWQSPRAHLHWSSHTWQAVTQVRNLGHKKLAKPFLLLCVFLM